MEQKVSAEAIVAEILSRWEQVLHPEAPIDLWDAELSQLFPDDAVENITDFNYEKGHWYAIRLHPGPLPRAYDRQSQLELLRALGGGYSSISLAISAVLPYFKAEVIRTEIVGEDQIRIRSEDNPAYRPQLEALRRHLLGLGLRELPAEILRTVIPDVVLELAEPGKVTVEHCLFSDDYTDMP